MNLYHQIVCHIIENILNNYHYWVYKYDGGNKTKWFEMEGNNLMSGWKYED
jgi:hypothetical protein